MKVNEKVSKHPNTNVQSETLTLIKQQFFKTKMCPFQKNKNFCLNESNCHYAHSLDELKPMPNLSNTKLCEYVKKKIPCQNVNCKFAHDIETLKPSVHLATYKSAICSFWGKGKCFNGNKCRFAHGDDDIKRIDNKINKINNINNINNIKDNNNNNNNNNKEYKNNKYLYYENINNKKEKDLKYSVSTEYSNGSDERLNYLIDEETNGSYYKNNKIPLYNKTNSGLSYDVLNKDKNNFNDKCNDKEMFSNSYINTYNMNERKEKIKNEKIDNLDYYEEQNETIKDLIDRLENMSLNSGSDNTDKYAKMIKYLVKENTRLKESFKNKNNIMENEENKNYSLENSKTTEQIDYIMPKNVNINDNININKYDKEESYININAKTFEDPKKMEENESFTNIIKTIDDILISQNADSFVCTKDNVDDIIDNSSELDNKDTFVINNNVYDYEKIMPNIKSFESLKNYCSESCETNKFNKNLSFNNTQNFDFNKNMNHIENKKIIKNDENKRNEIIEMFQHSFLNERIDKKVHNFNENDAYIQNIGKKNLHKEKLMYNGFNDFLQNKNCNKMNFEKNTPQKQDIKNIQNLLEQNKKNMFNMQNNSFLNNSNFNKNTINYDNISGIMFSNNMNDMNISNNMNDMNNCNNNNNNNNMNGFNHIFNDNLFNKNLIKQNQENFSFQKSNIKKIHLNQIENNLERNIFKEKNTKLNISEQKNINDDNLNLNLEKILENASDKTEFMKKLRDFLTNELQNNEKEKYTHNENNTKFYNKDDCILNGKNISNDLSYSSLINENYFQSVNFSNDIPTRNLNSINNMTKNMSNVDNDFINNSNFMEEIHGNNLNILNNEFTNFNKEKNVWSNMNTLSSHELNNFSSLGYNTFTHDWMKNNNSDFFNNSQSINLSSLN